MFTFYGIIVILLFALAITDLIVGVSNDAVNFLNSAIGSKVASRRTIMIVASLGILLGATFSSGMMEVARKGIFNPAYFYFADIMIIFLAVMITDIILLDLFNTFGMPTSTTVSIVFELLGAAVAVALLKISASGESLSTLQEYINSSSAIIIISGIFLSVLIAFAVGSIIQYFSRLLFTFHLQKRQDWLGSLWAGLALTALTYFLLIKGLKGASFVSGDFIAWIQENTLLLISISLVVWSVVMHLMQVEFKVQILRIIVLFGTFALAMAFAGNDLVNFIGVPIAGFESYLSWSDTSVPAGEFEMTTLNEAVRTKTYLLVAAGVIMITTLWFSKKARSVTETEVNLGRQDEGSERFRANLLARGIVRYSIAVAKQLSTVLPARWTARINARFTPEEPAQPTKGEQQYDPPAFDLVRASVNLTVASMLIAFATSLKLPLSTTYVSFMVAMGTSLADRAWGRGSAVYRISGVINVIGGWFFTAIMAFTAAAIFAVCIYFFSGWAIAALVGVAAFSITRSFRHHREKEKTKEELAAMMNGTEQLSTDRAIRDSASRASRILGSIKQLHSNALRGLITEDLPRLQHAVRDLANLRQQNEELEFQLYHLIQQIEEETTEGSRIYLSMYDLTQDLLQSTGLIVGRCQEYVDNSLVPLNEEEAQLLQKLGLVVQQYFDQLIQLTNNGGFNTMPVATLQSKKVIFKQLEEALTGQVMQIKLNGPSRRKSLMMLSVLLETKDLVEVAIRFAKLYQRTQALDQDELLLAPAT